MTVIRRAGPTPFEVRRLRRVVDDLPMTASAKAQRPELHRWAAGEPAILVH